MKCITEDAVTVTLQHSMDLSECVGIKFSGLVTKNTIPGKQHIKVCLSIERQFIRGFRTFTLIFLEAGIKSSYKVLTIYVIKRLNANSLDMF